MRVCGLGGPELVILALLLFVVFGPERTREVALAAGRFLGKLMKSEWWADFTRMVDEIRNLPTTLVRMAELEEAQAELEKTVSELRGELDSDLEQDVKVDPWGIENAVAQTTRLDDQPPPPEPGEADDTEPPDEAGQDEP
jgi:Sec-independent protein translocase protein TatA